MKISEYFDHKFRFKSTITRKELIGVNQKLFTPSQIDSEIKKQIKAGRLERTSPGVYKIIPVELDEEQIKADEELIKRHMKRAQKKAARITRKQKLYVRGSNGELRRLDKISPQLYGQIILLFLKGDGEQRYSLMNQGVEHWKDLKGISMPLDLKDEGLFKNLQKVLKNSRKVITVYHNASWKPLVELQMYVPKEQMEEVKITL